MNIQSAARTRRNGHIELLRFLFCIIILVYHTSGFFNNGSRIFAGGYLAVEFFFLLSGVFLGKHLRSVQATAKDESITETVSASWEYLFRRWVAIYPCFFLSTIVGLCVNYTAGTWSFLTLGGLIRHLPAEFLALQNYGFSILSATGIMWYIAAMFFAIWVIYPIARRCYDLYVKYIAIVLGLVTIGLLVRTYGTLNVPNSNINGIVNTGFLRAIAMMSLGLVLNEICAFLETYSFSKKYRYLLSFAELCLFLTLIYFMSIQGENRGGTDGSAVIILFIAMLIVCSGKSAWHNCFDSSVVMFLGKFSSVLFMNHYYWCLSLSSFCKMLHLNFDTNQKIICVFILSALTSLLVSGAEKVTCLIVKGYSKKAFY